MYNGKRLLGLIPARSGSKGLPNKNIRSFCGKPLLGRAVETAIESEMFDTVFVSTDIGEYADISVRYGASVPFLRPAAYARDESAAEEYIMHALNEFKKNGEEFDYFALMQPTSPLRTAELIREGVRMAVDQELTSVVSFCEAEHPPGYYHKLPDDLSLGGIDASRGKNRQEYGKFYRVSGLLYVCGCEFYLRNATFYGGNGRAMVVDAKHSIDIDSDFDFAVAEFVFQSLMSPSLQQCGK
jgi:CMP-N-acetylneuraminic acid synthetase